MSSVAIVPAGLTKFRDKLYPLTDFTREEASSVIDLIDEVGEKMLVENGSRVFFAADEFYLKAEREIPSAEYYEDYPQIENGVGMLRSVMDEFKIALSDLKSFRKRNLHGRRISVATGVAAYPFVSELSAKLMKMCRGLQINVYKITNNFFGESITVSGLLTGKDIYEQLKDKELYDELLIPENALKYGEEIFLCGMSVGELSERLGVKVAPSSSDGYGLCECMLGESVNK
jgi:NifB/MoaA-like Fe-S oxidoreductase